MGLLPRSSHLSLGKSGTSQQKCSLHEKEKGAARYRCAPGWRHWRSVVKENRRGAPRSLFLIGPTSNAIRWLSPCVKKGPGRYNSCWGPRSLYLCAARRGRVDQGRYVAIFHWQHSILPLTLTVPS